MTTELKPCPCGEVPEKLIVYLGFDDGIVYGSCCKRWASVFWFQHCDSREEAEALGAEAWNSAPRGGE